MGLPSQKRTKSSKRRRASHFALKTKNLIQCSKCKKMILPHHLCPFCGTYNKKEIVKIKTRKKK